MERIASATVSAAILADITRSFEVVQRTGEQLASGRLFDEPSQNPQGMARADELQSSLGGLEEYAANVSHGLGFERAAAGAVSSISAAVQKARQVITQAGSGVDNKQQLASLAEVVEGLIEQVKVEADTQFGGQYVFAGTAITTAPYSTGSEDTYHGNGEAVEVTIGKGITVPLGANIEALLGNGAAAGDGKLLDVLRTAAALLREGTPEALERLRTATLEGLTTNEATLVDIQTHIGLVTAQLEHTEAALEALRDDTQRALAETTEVNFPRAASEYAGQQVAYEAAMKTGAQLIQLSLLDFLH
jgi:flagellar hook-associated protein 3 FlgL